MSNSRKFLDGIKSGLECIDDFDGKCEISCDIMMSITYTNSVNTHESIITFLVHNNKFKLHTESIHKFGDVPKEGLKIYSMCAPNIEIIENYLYYVYVLFKLHTIFRMEKINDQVSTRDVPSLCDLYVEYKKQLDNLEKLSDNDLTDEKCESGINNDGDCNMSY